MHIQPNTFDLLTNRGQKRGADSEDTPAAKVQSLPRILLWRKSISQAVHFSSAKRAFELDVDPRKKLRTYRFPTRDAVINRLSKSLFARQKPEEPKQLKRKSNIFLLPPRKKARPLPIPGNILRDRINTMNRQLPSRPVVQPTVNIVPSRMQHSSVTDLSKSIRHLSIGLRRL